LIYEAEGQAAAAKTRGAGEAEAARALGLAEAEVIRAKGEAEAEAMRVKALAYHEYNQAAVLDKLLADMPNIARAIAEPLAKVNGITIVSTGSNGSHDGLGASRLTNDMINIAAQVPALFEALSGGLRLEDLMKRVPTSFPGQQVEANPGPDGTKISSKSETNGKSK
jgi:flotillin